jgi:hypothetical protein
VDANTLLGTWRLKSYVVTTAEGERLTPYGENPVGYLSYSSDGRMQVIAVAEERIIPDAAHPTAPERAALYDTMFAYAGSYSVVNGKVRHQVDTSWNGVWTGTEQIRGCELEGNTLILTTLFPDPETGALTHYAVAWEKIIPPA